MKKFLFTLIGCFTYIYSFSAIIPMPIIMPMNSSGMGGFSLKESIALYIALIIPSIFLYIVKSIIWLFTEEQEYSYTYYVFRIDYNLFNMFNGYWFLIVTGIGIVLTLMFTALSIVR